jgi:hypothetical protein
MADQSNEQPRELTAEEADLVTGGALGRFIKRAAPVIGSVAGLSAGVQDDTSANG